MDQATSDFIKEIQSNLGEIANGASPGVHAIEYEQRGLIRSKAKKAGGKTYGHAWHLTAKGQRVLGVVVKPVERII